MLLFENTKVFNLEGALRGMRNPMDSWDKSDSYCESKYNTFIIGENDLKLAKSLIKGGAEHRKFLRQIFISVDITAPRYWWVEFDTYCIGVSKNSCSTMHTLMKKPITIEMFDIEIYKMNEEDINYWNSLVKYLELLRDSYIKERDFNIFIKLKKALPESFLQKRTVAMNYENVINIYNQRKTHKLFEWSENFADWVKSLPYGEDFLINI